MKMKLPGLFATVSALAAFSLFLSVGVAGVLGAAAPSITALAVKPGATVTIRAHDFPGGQLFTVRMDKENSLSASSPAVDVTNTGAGGTFDETYKIPAALKNEPRIAIRFDSPSGVVVSGVFANTSPFVSLPTPLPGGTTVGKPHLTVIAAVQGQSLTVRADRFPANQDFVIRVGPYDTFFTDYANLGKINSGAGGSFLFVLPIPASAASAEVITIRLDGGGFVAFNASVNKTFGGQSGSTSTNPTPTPVSTLAPTPTPVSTLAPTPTPVSTLAPSGALPTALPGACQVLAVAPAQPVARGSDVDAVWTVKNTSAQAWDSRSVDYRFASGSSLHKKSLYDLPQTVQPGATVQIIVDMRAPAAVGSYSENWILGDSSSNFCNLAVTVKVR